MTQKEKNILLQDLCGRLPYGVILRIAGHDVTITTYNTWVYFGASDEAKEYIKPYLRPMSSMTEDEKVEYKHLVACSGSSNGASNFVDWLNAHHLDYRGLIPMDLALEAPEDMYNSQKE